MKRGPPGRSVPAALKLVVGMIDGQHILAKQSDLGNGLIPEGKPGSTDLLVMSGKICAFDPEKAFSPDDPQF